MLVRSLLALCISLSIGLIYYSKVVITDFQILSDPDGPDTTDYFIEEIDL